MNRRNNEVSYNLKQKMYDETGIEKSLNDSSMMVFNNLIWGIDEVCSFTKYAKGTIYNLVSKGEIPYRRGRRRKLIFIPSEIIDWLKGE